MLLRQTTLASILAFWQERFTRSSYYCFVILSIFIVLARETCIGLNNWLYGFQGNYYFSNDKYLSLLYLGLICWGFRLFFDERNKFRLYVDYIFLLYCTMTLIALFVDAIQLTPFTPIDSYLVQFERYLGVDILVFMSWTAEHTWFKQWLVMAYISLDKQLLVLPLLMIVAGQFKRLMTFFCLLLISTLIGFSVYYFLPTTAPASILTSTLFTPEQYATGIKFREIHQHLLPSTIEGGLISMPSFHVIWAWLCLYLIYPWPIARYLLIINNSVLALSCVLLGWHYVLDIIGSVLVIILSHIIYQKYMAYRLTNITNFNSLNIPIKAILSKFKQT
ncbi:MAG: hypothetical protein CMF38_04385 [Legionellaceae bacterium]|nr:hypothetical protein [Legionellaceae bacterium]HCA89847.1 hypothetical protein [Legionellales bacterium]|tara:strand:- start:683 stop:1684 length:1002 start_codon:yes stop_codon:yes gene_type:complete